MFDLFKSKDKKEKMRRIEAIAKLQGPKLQRAEGLYLLLEKGDQGVTRKQAMDEAYIMNFPEIVRVLRRDFNVAIITQEVKRVNKFGRDITYGRYVIPEGPMWDAAIERYDKINNPKR